MPEKKETTPDYSWISWQNMHGDLHRVLDSRISAVECTGTLFSRWRSRSQSGTGALAFGPFIGSHNGRASPNSNEYKLVFLNTVQNEINIHVHALLISNIKDTTSYPKTSRETVYLKKTSTNKFV